MNFLNDITVNNNITAVGTIQSANLTLTGLSTGSYTSILVENSGIVYKRDLSLSLLPTGTEGQMLYNNAGTWTAFSGVFWDDTNNRLGLGVTASLAAKLHTRGAGTTSSTYTGRFEDSAGTEILRIRDDGEVSVRERLPDATYGAELITNGAFTTDLSGWTVGGADWTWVSGAATHAATGATTMSQLTATNATHYRVKFDYVKTSGTSVTFAFGGVTLLTVTTNGTGNNNTFDVLTVGTTGFVVTPTSDFVGSFDNVTITQYSASAAPGLVVYNSDGTTVAGEIRFSSLANNVAIGDFALRKADVNSHNNTVVGHVAMQESYYAYQNTVVGSYAGRYINNGYGNAFFGYFSGGNTTSGFWNTGVGASSFTNLTTGSSNVAVGFNALRGITTANYNTGVGHNAFYNTTGSLNTGVGIGVGFYNTSGANNVYMGVNAGYNNGTGGNNTGIGYQALLGVNGNSYSNNTGLGYNVGTGLTTGSNNVLVGHTAGDNITTGSNNLVFGYAIDAPSATTSNQMTIGNALFGVSIDGTGTTISTGRLGAFVAAPTAKFHLPAGVATASGAPLKFTSGTNLSAAEAGAVEWDGTNLYITQTSGPTRKTIAYTDTVAALTVTNDTTTNATMYPTWVTANTGNLPQKVSSTKFTFNPSTGNVDCYGIYTSGHAIALYAGSYQINVTSGMTHTGIYTNNIGGKAIDFTNGTSNWIQWGTGGIGAPTFTTSSVGTKLLLYPLVGASNADYAIGIESGAMWFGVTTSGNAFKWYGGTTLLMSLSGTTLAINGNTALHAGNYNSYAPTLTGTGASGTWGISITGTATNATNTAITDDTTTNATMYPTWVTTTTGNLPQKISSTKLFFNPSAGQLAANDFNIGSSATVIGTTQSPSEYGGPKSLLEFAMIIGSAIGVADPFRYKTPITKEYWNGSVWSTDSTTDWSGALAPGYHASANIITNTEYGAGTTKKRMVIDTGAQFSRSNFIIVQRAWNGAAVAGTVDIESSPDNSAWTSQVTGQVLGGAVYLSMSDAGSIRYWRITITCTSSPGVGNTLSIRRIMGLAPQPYSVNTYPIYINSSGAVTITGTCTAAVTNLAAGATGSLPYQSAASTTAFLALGTTNYVLTAGASAPQWTAQSSLTAGNATNIGITDDNATNANMYPVWVTTNTGNLPAKVSSTKFSFNPSTGLIDVNGISTSNHAVTLFAGSYQINATSGITHTGIYTNNIGGKAIDFTHGTSNYIQFNQAGLAAPAVTSVSAGTKIVLYNAISGVQVDYALGMESGAMWFSVPTTAGTYKWYGGTTSMMQLSNSVLTIGGNTALHAGNYNTYAPTLTGTGASGTWGISITGNAATTTITDDNATNATVYLTWVGTASGSQSQKTSSGWLTFNPSTGLFNAGQITSKGGSGGFLITRRDTSAAAWQWYSTAGSLSLYDHVGATDRLTWTSGNALTIASASTTFSGASGITVSGGASTLKAAAYGSAATYFAVFPADPGTTAQALNTRTATQVRSDISAAASGAITGSGLTMSTARMLGRTTAATGAIEEITVGTGLALASTTLSTSGAYTANGYTMSTARLLGRTTASSGAAEEISLANGTNCSATLATGVLTIAISSTPTFTDCTVTGRLNLPTSQPGSPVNGSCYWDGTTNKFWVYSSTYGWKSVTLT